MGLNEKIGSHPQANFHRISKLSWENYERFYKVSLEPVRNNEGLPTVVDSGDAHYFLPDYELAEGYQQEDISFDVKEAHRIMDEKRKRINADSVVGVSYMSPHCKKLSDDTLLAQGYAMKIIEEHS